MKKSKVFIAMILVLIVLFSFSITIATTGLSPNDPNVGISASNINSSTKAENAIKRAWGSAKLILQVLALSTILGCGIRYMMVSADQKAEIKKSLTTLVIGAAIVFGTTYVVDFITTIAGNVMVVK